ncbi:MAG: DNA-binding protein WhiA [Oscillospiraceae bacterium]|nr:DNA-binding protein WhiA [Oscillospiraceae bacterium]
MSFCQEVKKELCRIEPKKLHCREAALYGVLRLSRTFPQEEIVFKTENKFFADRFAQQLAAFGTFVEVRSDLRRLKGDTPVHPVIVSDSYQRQLLSRHFMLDLPGLHPAFIEQPCCIAAFFREIFLAFGSVTNPEKEYHLEINALNAMFAEEMYLLAQNMGIRFKTTKRKGCDILYLKESEQIEDFLTFLGATKSVLKLMDIKVMKDVRNKVNRTTNCETANLKKTVSAAGTQAQDIRFILEHRDITWLDEDLRELALLRVQNEDLSLRELAARLSVPLSRSGVNHRLRRIAEAAEKLRSELENA